jgi:hypothetical protein
MNNTTTIDQYLNTFVYYVTCQLEIFNQFKQLYFSARFATEEASYVESEGGVADSLCHMRHNYELHDNSV